MTQPRITPLSTLLISLLLAASSPADIQLATIFGDSMVLQQNQPVPVWGRATAGEKVTVTFNGQEKTALANDTGAWNIKLDRMQAGGPFTLTATGNNTVSCKDVYVGEVWLCSGQSNMDMTVAKEDRYWCGVENEDQEVAAANHPLIRVFDVEFKPTDTPQTAAAGKWEICSPATVGHFSAVAYFFARELQKKYPVPIGLITTAYGASTAEAWTSRPALEAHGNLRFLLDNYQKACGDYDSGQAKQNYDRALDKWKQEAEKAKTAGLSQPRKPGAPRNPHEDQHSPCVLYNGMVAPLVPYAIRGALWYQGESNGPTDKIYDIIMDALISGWRKAWGQGDFPFLYVQLANNGDPQTLPARGGGMTRTREGQLKNLSIPHTAMAVAADIGDAKNIHPKNKQALGLRLSLAARALVYGESIPFSGPVYESMTIEGNCIRLHFKHTDGGLVARGGELKGFAIAGVDKNFVWAQTRIDGQTVVVSNPEVSQPAAVRYGWDANPILSLYNGADLPASPFRTDSD